MLRVRWDMDGVRRFDADLRKVERALDRWPYAAGNPAGAALHSIAQYHRGLFESGGAGGLGRASGTGPWAALRARTVRARALRIRCSRIQPRDYAGPGGGGRILVWSLRLKSSLTGSGAGNQGDMIRRVGRHSLTYGTSCPTAAFHQDGRAGYNPMPARPPVDMIVGPEVGLDAIEARIGAFLDGVN